MQSMQWVGSRSDMSVVVPVDDNRFSLVQQRAPAQDGDIDHALQCEDELNPGTLLWFIIWRGPDPGLQ
jgi:hypothetical protein